jgi:tetratricopeptide (TPR) repeat protein
LRRISLIFFIFLNTLFIRAQKKVPEDQKILQYQHLLQLNDDSVKCARLITYAAKLSDSLSDFKFAQLIFEKTNTLLHQKEPMPANFRPLLPWLYIEWGLCLHGKGEYEAADKIYSKALEYTDILNSDLKLKAKLYNRTGINLMALTLYKRALFYFNEAVELFTKLDDEVGKGKVYHNMATMFMLNGNYKQSDEFFDKAADIHLKYKRMARYYGVLNSKAILKAEQGKYQEAKSIFLKVLRSPQENMEFYVNTHYNTGLIYAELKDWDSCFYFQKRGKWISDSLKINDVTDGGYYYNFGDCYMKRNEIEKAIASYKLALKHKSGIHSFRKLYDRISQLYFEKKQYDSALIYKNESGRISDSIYKNELNEHISFENKRLELLEKDYQNQVRATQQQQFLSNFKKRNSILLGTLIVLIILALLFFFYLKQLRLKLKKEKLQKELDFLKAQLNPHFLFNSLNNIYVLLDQDKNKAMALLIQFCELMRYQLYDCDADSISLSEELRFLKNYIDFEKLRYGDNLKVEDNLKELTSEGFQIAPILLQPFIENAFRHAPKSRHEPGRITVHAALTGHSFSMEVKNSVGIEEKTAPPGEAGLENVKKRLKLLYPNKHELGISSTDAYFQIQLKITLD